MNRQDAKDAKKRKREKKNKKNEEASTANRSSFFSCSFLGVLGDLAVHFESSSKRSAGPT